MGEEEGCENRKSDVVSLGRKLKLHMVKAIVRLNNSSLFLDIYQMLFVSLIYLLNL